MISIALSSGITWNENAKYLGNDVLQVASVKPAVGDLSRLFRDLDPVD